MSDVYRYAYKCVHTHIFADIYIICQVIYIWGYGDVFPMGIHPPMGIFPP